MTNLEDSRRDLESYIAARVPFIVIRTIEQPRALRLLRDDRHRPAPGQPAVQRLHQRARAAGPADVLLPVRRPARLTGALEYAAQQFASRPRPACLRRPRGSQRRHPGGPALHRARPAADDNSGSVILITDTPVWSGWPGSA